jgi:zinc transport system substrate-binding protein
MSVSRQKIFSPIHNLTPILLCLLLIPLSLNLHSCAKSEKPADQKLLVVASIYPLYDWVRQIGGDRVDAHCLIPSGASPHTFSPTPADMMLVAKARLFFRIGRGLELWADKLINAASSSSLKVVTLSDGLMKLYVNPLSLNTDASGGYTTDSSILDNDRVGADPHVWMDPILAQDMVRKIAQELVSSDPASKSYYEQNLLSYLEELKSLDAEIRTAISPLRQRSFVGFHSALLYFAHRYGLNEAAVIEEFPGKEPSISYLQHLIVLLKQSSTRAVLAEHQLNDKIALALADEAQAKLVYLDPLGNPDDPQRNTYINLVRYNVHQLVEALK